MVNAFPSLDAAGTTPIYSRTAQVLAAIAGALGLATMAGWYTHNVQLIQLREDLSPMAFNSAALLLLAGSCLFALARKHLLWVRLIAGFSLLVSALTMLQSFTSLDLGIDNLLMDPHLASQPLYNGRMALTSAFCFVLLSIGFIMFTLDRSSEVPRAMATLFASIAIACVIATVVGIKTDIQPLFGWKATTFMALHTAFGIFVLAIGILVCSLDLKHRLSDHNHMTSAAAGFIVVATATLLLWSGLTRQQDEQQLAGLDADLHWLNASINVLYLEHIDAIDRMAQRWEAGKGTPHTLWDADARAYLHTLPGLRSLAWTDSSGLVQWQQNAGSSALIAGVNLTGLAEVAPPFQLARDKHKPAFTSPIVSSGMDSTFLMIRPLTVDGHFDGALVAEFPVAALFNNLLQQDPTIAFEVKFGNRAIYASPRYLALADTNVMSEYTPLAIGEGGWRLEIKDATSLSSDLRSLLPVILLVVGLVFAVFFSALLGLGGISRQNLLEARRANEALLRSKQQLNQFRTTLDRTLDCVFMIDAPSLTFYYGNSGALRLTGWTEDELYWKHPWEVSNFMSEEGFRKLIAPLVNLELDSITFDSSLQNADGSSTPVECFLQYIAVAGEAPRFVAIMRDITQRQRIEKMKTEFVSTVSHELRTPLTSITGALGLVRGGALGEVSSTVQDMIDIAYKNSRRLTHLINDLLDIERIAAGKVNFDMQVQRLMPLIEQVVEGTRTYGTENKVSLLITGTAPEAEVRVDSQRLLQILSNLLSNAVKFSPERGVVEISVEQRSNKVRINVRDQGRGIPDEFRGRIFQKFAQADASDTRRQSGTGLGLAISHELAERMGGVLSYTSVFGQGSCFWLELPLSNPRIMSTTQPEQCQVLHVEDDADLHAVISNMGGSKFEFTLASTLVAARTRLQDKRYHAVIIDLELPDGSGWDLMPLIREMQPDARLIILTGQEATAVQHGNVDAVLLKSRVTPDQLLAAITASLKSA